MNLKDKILEGFKKATVHNSSVMVAPEVILWPDLERQWEPVIGNLQADYGALFVLGEYQPEKLTGPAIWLKTVVSGTLSDCGWHNDLTPIIYLPGISRSRLKDVSSLGLDLQPLAEYQYTGTFFNQYNSKEWTVLALLTNQEDGLGLSVKQDSATKEALIKSLPVYFEMDIAALSAPVIDAEFINGLVFPNVILSILKWMSIGDDFLSGMDPSLKETFRDMCQSRYGFIPDHKNIKEIALKLGKQENAWKHVWSFYANSPSKYPIIETLLREAKPEDLGEGFFSIPCESWPQINEEREAQLRDDLEKLTKKDIEYIKSSITNLYDKHKERKKWVWTELGYSPLVTALEYLTELLEYVNNPYPSASLDEIIQYYTQEGFYSDTCMRKAYAAVKTEKDKSVIRELIQLIYKPWLERITEKFQNLVINNFSETKQQATKEEKHSFYLFVDALRYEMAREYVSLLDKRGFKVGCTHLFAALPTLTSTAKVKSSPVAEEVNTTSEINDFTPFFKTGKPANITNFRAELENKGYMHSIKKGFDPERSYWVEIGNIDTRGHEEQSEMLKRADELFDEISEVIDTAIEAGVREMKIVTDHGWLMLPGGLPSAKIVKDLTIARCGRCAYIKEGVKTNLTHLPWEWNPSVYIGYAPGISFFRNNEEYAHGGISLQECIIPVLNIFIPQKEIITAKIVSHRWAGLRCIIETENTPDGFIIDIRTKYNDENTSVVISSKQSISDNNCSVMVEDSAIDSAAVIVLTDEKGKIIDKINTTIGN